MTGRRALVVGLLLLLLGAPTVTAGELSDGQRRQILAEAAAAYDDAVALLPTDAAAARRGFADAARRFRQLADDGIVNGHLEYNIANAYLQAGDLGRAILHYRRAERLIPGDPRLEHNLRYARSLKRDRIEPSGRRALGAALLGWHRAVALPVRIGVVAFGYGAFWALLIVNLLRPAPAWRWLAAAAAAAWLAAGASIALSLAGDGDDAGVITAAEVVVRQGNGEGFEPRFSEPLGRGVEFRRLDRRGGWYQVELADGSTGWIPTTAAALVDPD